MTIESLQTQNDTRLTNIVALILIVGLLCDELIVQASAIGLFFVLCYLISVMMFLNACEKDNESSANIYHAIAINCQIIHLAIVPVVLTLMFLS